MRVYWRNGKTQNQNESFNSMIWDRIHKKRFVSLTKLEVEVYDAVPNFNIGKKSCFNLLKNEFDTRKVYPARL